MVERQRARQEFISSIAGNDASIDLARTALLIAAEEYPDLDIDKQFERLEELAVQVRLHLHKEEKQTVVPPTTMTQGREVLRALNTVLFVQEQFQGNRADYYNPQNSFLNEVLARRLGIPLTLSLVYMEVGKRLGLHMEGIGMPFHFMLRCSIQKYHIYIDPFEKGKLLREQDCRQRISQIFKDPRDFDPHWLEPLSHKQVLVRMLTNLKHIYLHKGDYARALTVCDRILLINPNLAVEVRDRGVIHFQLKYFARALRDLNAYLEMAPQATDLQEIRQQIRIIKQLIAMMN
jgi:regulator of sirC expression with transglutaminase-like and TPR domain